MSSIADSQALPTYEDMLNIFANFNDDAAVSSGTQAQDNMKPICQSFKEPKCIKRASSNMTSSSCTRGSQVCADSFKTGVDLDAASESEKLLKTFARDYSARLSDKKYVLGHQPAFPTECRQTAYAEENDRDRLPTCEDMFRIFVDLESSETCHDETWTQQNESKTLEDKMTSLHMGATKLHDEYASPQSPLDVVESPSSIISMNLVCK